MGDQTTVSYKVYLYKQEYSTPKGPALEVRRVGIDRDVSTSFAYLKEKLASVFPILGRTKTKSTIVWQDEENEWITIRSDEELVIALTEMEGPVYKLHVQFTNDDNDTKSPSLFDLMGDCTIEGKQTFHSKTYFLLLFFPLIFLFYCVLYFIEISPINNIFSSNRWCSRRTNSPWRYL